MKYKINYYKFTTALILTLVISNAIKGQNLPKQPRIVVGIVVDQMRYDYLERFYDRFEEGGFKRLMDKGYNVKNTHYNYTPTKTGPGHASIYTGTTPMHHGIIGNKWYDRATNKVKTCVEDTSVTIIGSNLNQVGKSPSTLLTTTITDELKLASKNTTIIGISLKDRGAILPAGHLANGAYWYDDVSGKFITSSYYMASLPKWLEKFNSRKVLDSLTTDSWKPFRSYDNYKFNRWLSSDTQKTSQDNYQFLHSFRGLKKEDQYIALTESPFGNTILRMLAMEAIEHEKMGQGATTDFLTISFSSTDKIGHKYGLHCSELEDTYLRLDYELSLLFNYLDQQVGNNNYLVFLTADHAASDEPGYLINRNIPAGYYDQNVILKKLNQELQLKMGEEGLVVCITNEQVYFDHEKINQKQLSLEKILEISYQWLIEEKGVSGMLSSIELTRNSYCDGLPAKVQKGYYPKRSGDMLMWMSPSWIQYRSSGTDHGSGFSYDTHVPMLWYGWHIPTGSSFANHNITDIAPTLAMLLGLKWPNATTGQPIIELLEQ